MQGDLGDGMIDFCISRLRCPESIYRPRGDGMNCLAPLVIGSMEKRKAVAGSGTITIGAHQSEPLIIE